MISHIWLNSGPVHVSMQRMKIATLSLPLLTTLERVLQLLPATQSTTLNWLANCGMGRRNSSTTTWQPVWMKMGMPMRMESLRPVEDILRYIQCDSL